MFTKVSNVASKYNGVTQYRLCHVLDAITFKNKNGSNFSRAITLGCDNGTIELEAITFLNCAKTLCDNAKCNIVLSLKYGTLGTDNF